MLKEKFMEKIKKIGRKVRFSTVFLVFITIPFSLGGCAPIVLKANFNTDIDSVPRIDKRIPVKAALYIPESAKQYHYRAVIPFGEWQYPFGEHIEKVSYNTFSQVFEELVLVRDKYNFDAYDLIIEPDFSREDTRVSMSISQIDVTVGINCYVSDRDSIIWRKTFTGNIVTGGQTTEMTQHGKAMTRAFEKAANQMYAEFGNNKFLNNIYAKRKKSEKIPSIAQSIEGNPRESFVPPHLTSRSEPAAAARVSDIDINIPKTNTSNKDAIAVVIGNRDYKDKDIPSVDFALNDAETVKKYLVSVLGYREGNIIYETNATKAVFEMTFGTERDYKGKLYNYLKKGKSDIFIYYSGHGAPDTNTNSGFFVPSDASPQAIGLTGYPLKQLYDNIAKISGEMNTPNTFVVVDACFSGASEKGLLIKNVSPITIKVKTPLLDFKNAVVITSSSGSEVSSWYPEKGHSMFTYFFLQGLKGMVEEGRKNITANDVYSFVADETDGLPYYVRRLHGRVQTPQIMGAKNSVLVGE